MHNETPYTIPEQDGQMAKEPAAVSYALNHPQSIVLTIPAGQNAKYLRGKVVAFYNTLLNESEKTKEQFDIHYQKWLKETMFLSSTTKITSHLDFRAIVDMGEDVVPFIIEKLEQTPSFLYKALELIYNTRLLPIETENVNGIVWAKEQPLENCKLWIQKLK